MGAKELAPGQQLEGHVTSLFPVPVSAFSEGNNVQPTW